MSQVTIRDVTIGFRGPDLLVDVSCRIEMGERIGLLGRNGSGKTTLLRMLAGLEQPDHGVIEFANGTKVAHLPQEVPRDIVGQVRDVIAQGLCHTMRSPDMHWKADQLTQRVLMQMELDGDADFSRLSTGMQRRVLLAQAIVGEPEVLLLDEPTNHLDIDSITWLETFLGRLRSSLIFVTHDRTFLTKLANRILEIDRGKLFDWTCDYKTFLVRKENAIAAEEKQAALFDKRLSEEEAWIRTGIKARRTRNEGRVRALEAMRRQLASRRKQDGQVRLQIDTGDRSGALVCEAREATFGYDGKPVVERLNTTIMRGDKVGIVGRNGAGKSTVLKGLLGHLSPMAGKVRLGTNLQVAYFDQTRQQLDPDKTAEDNVGEGKTTIQVGDKSKHIIGYLQDFLFTPEQARSPIRFFSGGQRNRLLLAKLFSKPANLLVLDEPTNDLDTETLELLEEKLVEYQGTVLVVSHDREFLNNVVSSILAIEAPLVSEYVGGYDDWLRQKEFQGTSSDELGDAPKSASMKSSVIPSFGDTKPRKLSFKEQRELEQLPGMIESLEREQAELHIRLSSPEFYKQEKSQIAAQQEALKTLEAKLEASYRRWEELEG